jgi:uncharacterized membrane protein YgcG
MRKIYRRSIVRGRRPGSRWAWSLKSLSKFSTKPISASHVLTEIYRRRLRTRAKLQGESSTRLQAQSLTEQRAALSKNIKNWEPLRAIYIPGLLQYQTETGNGGPAVWENGLNPEDIDLFLPSQLPTGRREAACTSGLPNMEAELRNAQCLDALSHLRQTLRLKTRMIQFKNGNIRGQREGIRSRALIDRVHQRALSSVDKYRAAREAFLVLSGPGSWEKALQPLLNADVRSYVQPEGRKDGPGRVGIWEDGCGPGDPKDQDGGSEEIIAIPEERTRRDGTGWTKNTVLWIWRAVSAEVGGDGEGDDNILRSEWARSRARVRRCKEEVLLLLEEMRRVLEFLEWRAKWWEARRKPRTNISPELQEGLEAYATGQATDQRALSIAFQKVWKTPLNLVDDIDSSNSCVDANDNDDDDEDGCENEGADLNDGDGGEGDGGGDGGEGDGGGDGGEGDGGGDGGEGNSCSRGCESNANTRADVPPALEPMQHAFSPPAIHKDVFM